MEIESPHEKPNAVVPQWYLSIMVFNRNLQPPESPKNTADKHKVIVY